MIRPPMHAQRVDHPGGPLRRQREGMVGVPVCREGQRGIDALGWQCCIGDRNVYEVEIEVSACGSRVRRSNRVSSRRILP